MLKRNFLVLFAILTPCILPSRAAPLTAQVSEAQLQATASNQWTSRVNYTQQTLQLPVGASSSIGLRINVTRTSAITQMQVTGKVVITGLGPAQVRVAAVRAVLGTVNAVANCNGQLLPPGALITCTFSQPITPAGRVVIGTLVQYSVDPSPAVQLYNSPPGVGPTVDTANPTLPPSPGACAQVRQTFADGGDNVQPSSVSGDLPGATGTQVCESRVFSGTVVFGPLPAATLARLSDGSTAGSCEPGTLRATDTVTLTPEGQPAVRRDTQVTITPTGCSPSLTTTLTNTKATAQSPAAQQPQFTWGLVTSVSPASVTLGQGGPATFTVTVTRTGEAQGRASKGVPPANGVTLTGDVVVTSSSSFSTRIASANVIVGNPPQTIPASCNPATIPPSGNVTCKFSAPLPPAAAGSSSLTAVAVAKTPAGLESKSTPVVVSLAATAGAAETGCAELTATLAVSNGTAPPGFTPAANGAIPKGLTVCSNQTITFQTAFVSPNNTSKCGKPFTVSSSAGLTAPGAGPPKTATANLQATQPCASRPSPPPPPAIPLTGSITVSSLKVSKSSNWQIAITTTPEKQTVLYGGALFGSIATADVRYVVTYQKSAPTDSATAEGEVVVRNTGSRAVQLRSVGVLLDDGTVSSTSCGSLLLGVVDSEQSGTEEAGQAAAPAAAAARSPPGPGAATAVGASSDGPAKGVLQVPGNGTLKCSFSITLPASSAGLGVVVKPATERGTAVQVSAAKPLSSLGAGGQTLKQAEEDVAKCVTVGFEFLKSGVAQGEAAGMALVWIPDKVSGAVPASAGVAAAGKGEQICSSKEYRFQASFGPVGSRRCGDYQVPCKAVAWDSSRVVAASTTTALTLKVKDC